MSRKLHKIGKQRANVGSNPTRFGDPVLIHSSVSEDAYHMFIGWLNSRSNANTQRVVELIEACHEVSRAVESIKVSLASDARKQVEANKAIGHLNGCLLPYKWQPFIFGFMGAESHFRIQYSVVGEFNNPELSVEHLAIQWIMEHIDAVDRIRRCRLLQCRKWFFAKTDHQKYCNGNCRQRDASKGEAFKEKRRIYQKQYRRDQAQREARAKQLAKGRSK